MTEHLHVTHIDDPKGQTFEVAPAAVTSQIQRRLEHRPVVIHPTEPNVFIYDPANFWDGPTHVTFEPDTGHFTFSGWTGPEHFPAVGPIN